MILNTNNSNNTNFWELSGLLEMEVDFGWHPFSRPLDQIYEDMVEKEVKKRVEKELRIRALKKAQDEIGKY